MTKLRQQARRRVRQRLNKETAVIWQRKKSPSSVWSPPLVNINEVYLSCLDNSKRTQIYYGGSSSGKSVFLAQRCVIDVLLNERNYLICRAVARTIRKSVFVEIRKVIDGWELNGRFTVNKSEMIITCDNGYQILFTGLDDVEKLKSITPEKDAITDVWIEEATESGEDDIRQLLRRQRGGNPHTAKRLTLSFNPILKSHWIYQAYFEPAGWTDDQAHYESESLFISKTTYKDNRFLAQDEIDILENEPDKYWFNVYTLGNWGVLGDVIFKNWSIDDLSHKQAHWVNRRNGLDFGFSDDPAALVATHYDRKRKTIYIYAERYEYELTNSQLALVIEPVIKDDPVFCDSAEPKSIKELKGEGIRALAAAKGRDSVWHGIQWLKGQTIIVDSSCVKTISEFQQYQWKKDKHGSSMKVPIDKNNHIMDALRYAYERDMKGSKGARKIKYA
ncbi:MAG: PBSX family phage terminase large subunit [bacterium]|nr:PBSX family phage terminase large subunit [bacterium]